jgi:hypothetical protein
MQGNIATRAGFLLRNRACVQADIAVSLVRYLEIFVGAIVNLPVLTGASMWSWNSLHTYRYNHSCYVRTV